MAEKSRTPSYASGVRYAKIAMMLSESPIGIRVAALSRTLQVSSRTVDRYLSEFAKLHGPEGRPLCEITGQGSMRRLRLAPPRRGPRSNVYQAAALYLSLAILKFLDGTVLRSGVDDIWEQVRKNFPHDTQLRLADLDRKFYAVDYVPRDYRAYESQIDTIFKALLQEKRLKVSYGAVGRVGGSDLIHEFDPYTLVLYRGGLYLLGRSHHGPKIIYLLVERMRTVEILKDAQNQEVGFQVPRGFDPARFVQGAFGIVTEDQETEVVLKSRSPETDARLRARTVHPSQKISTDRDGRTILRLTVRGTAELANWIMTMSPYIEVVEPVALRQEIRRRLMESVQIYRNSGAIRNSRR